MAGRTRRWNQRRGLPLASSRRSWVDTRPIRPMRWSPRHGSTPRGPLILWQPETMRAVAVTSLLCSLLVACGGMSSVTRAPGGKPGSRPATPANRPVLLGSKSFIVWGGIGFGVAHPSKLVVGGDPAVIITRIRWHGWGRLEASGVGDYAAPHFGHGGDYYRKPLRAVLHASRIGSCHPNGPRAYMALEIRVALEPGQRPSWYQANGSHGLCRYP